MSGINEAKPIGPFRYYFGFRSDDTLDRNGDVPFQITGADYEMVKVESGFPGGPRDEIVPTREGELTLPMKKGIRPFALYYNANVNFLLAGPPVMELISPLDLRNVRQVRRIGSRFEDVITSANLAHLELFSTDVVFARSSFLRVDSNEFRIFATRVGRGELVPDVTHFTSAEEVQVNDFADYWRSRRETVLRKLIPTKLALSLDRAPAIFSLTVTLDLFSDDIALRMRSTPREGAWFPGPAVEVWLEPK